MGCRFDLPAESKRDGLRVNRGGSVEVALIPPGDALEEQRGDLNGANIFGRDPGVFSLGRCGDLCRQSDPFPRARRIGGDQRLGVGQYHSCMLQRHELNLTWRGPLA